MDSLALEHIVRVHTVVLEMYKDRGYNIEKLEKQIGLTPEEMGLLIDNNITNLQPLWFTVSKDSMVSTVIYNVVPWGDAYNVIRKHLDQEGANACLYIYFGGPSVSCKSEQRIIDDIIVQIHDFSQFLINPTKHYLVPKHTILSASEKARVLAELRINESQIPLIESKDPIMQWYDAKPGDLIRIMRTSNSAGKYIYYRLCF